MCIYGIFKTNFRVHSFNGIDHEVDEENITLYMDHKMLKNLGLDKAKVHGSINFNTSKLVVIVSCAHVCIIIGSRCNVGIEPNW
jgi:hypothetical protein